VEPTIVVATPVETQPPVVDEAPVVAAAPVTQEAPAPMPAPKPALETRTVARPAPAAFDPSEYLASAGLELVETRLGAAPVAETEVAPVKLGRPRRERPRTAADEALVQVETQK
jgi:hypothetical protein